jgi:hypothetical protein
VIAQRFVVYDCSAVLNGAHGFGTITDRRSGTQEHFFSGLEIVDELCEYYTARDRALSTRQAERGTDPADQSFAFNITYDDRLNAPHIGGLAKGRISYGKDSHGTWNEKTQP